MRGDYDGRRPSAASALVQRLRHGGQQISRLGVTGSDAYHELHRRQCQNRIPSLLSAWLSTQSECGTGKARDSPGGRSQARAFTGGGGMPPVLARACQLSAGQNIGALY